MSRSGTDREDSDPREKLEALEARLERLEQLLKSHIRISVNRIWLEQYRRLDQAVTDDAVSTLRVMIHEFITADSQQEILQSEGADGFEQWLRKLLVMQRIYEYLLFVRSLPSEEQNYFPDAEFATRRWLRELCWSDHFRIVHVRQGGFYPSFTATINKMLEREAQRAESLAEQCRSQARKSLEENDTQQLHDLARHNQHQAKKMRKCAALASTALRFEKFLEDERENPSENLAIHDLAANKGLYPLDETNFKRLWREYSEWLEGGSSEVLGSPSETSGDDGNGSIH